MDQGFVYHTEYDTLQQVEEGSVLRAGRNLLALTTTLAGMPLDGQMETNVKFFDVLGMWMMQYPAWLIWLNPSLCGIPTERG